LDSVSIGNRQWRDDGRRMPSVGPCIPGIVSFGAAVRPRGFPAGEGCLQRGPGAMSGAPGAAVLDGATAD